MKGRILTVGVHVADLMASPRQKKKLDLDDSEHKSQLLYGEVVALVEARGDWARVHAVEQPALGEGGAWHGYPGWVRSDALTGAAPTPPNVVVRTRQAILQAGSELLVLSVGTRLDCVSQDKGVALVRLLEGGIAEVPADALSVPPPAVTDKSRTEIAKTAELFLGTSYYWGGRSGVQPDLSVGVDCSGLVSLSYRVHGLDVPRDSHEQYVKARPLKRDGLDIGDLIFLTEPGEPNRVSHVMIYTGGDGVIESRKSSGRVLRSSFKERFGRALPTIESGAEVEDASFSKPKSRLIYFGTFL